MGVGVLVWGFGVYRVHIGFVGLAGFRGLVWGLLTVKDLRLKFQAHLLLWALKGTIKGYSGPKGL